MAILTKDEAQAILKKVLGFTKADECEAALNGGTGGNIRYARNSVSTSGEEENVSLAVEARFGKKSGIATINEFDDASLQKVVQRAEELARLAPENPEYMPMLGPQTYLNTNPFIKATADITPDFRAEAAFRSIQPADAKNVTAAGFMEDAASFQAKMNNKGMFTYGQDTNITFSVTMRTADGTGSGYATQDFNDVSKLDTGKVSQIAVDKALSSVQAKAIEPGKYTVILEPAALLANVDASLIGAMINNMDTRLADEGRSFLAKKGGGNKLGEKLFDERVTIYSDPTHPEIPKLPWAGDGRPLEKVTWIEKGVVKNMYNSRFWAQKQGIQSIAPPSGIIMEGGSESIEDMIKSTAKGILVTRFWYIRPVDPQTLLYTGLTRDGTFYIENGRIKHPIKNFRFNESPIIMLNNLESLGKPQRIGGNLIPPLKIRDFTFTSLSDAV
jgi:predicted Zn-dependent protease